MSYFPIMSIEQANPGLWRARQLAELDRQNREAMFAPFTLAQELKKMQQYNQYYPEDIQSQIGARNANTSLHQAMADWFGPTAQSHIDLINQAQIPTALANNAYTGAQTRGLNTENTLKSRLAQLYGIEMPTQYADQNNYTAPENNNYSMPNIDVSSFDKNPTTYTGGVLLSAPQYEKMYQQYAQNATTPEAVAFHDLNPPNPVQYNALLNQPKTSPQQQPALSNAYEQAQQINNAPIQEQAPSSISEYMRNIGITPPQTNMSMAPQGQEYAPSPQNLNTLKEGIPAQRAPQQAQIPAQMPTPEQMRQREIANISQLLGKKVPGETLGQKEDIKEEHAIKKEDRTVYRKLTENANKTAKDAKMMKTLVNQFEDAYKKTGYKGPIKGIIPGRLAGSEARLADNAALNMQSIAAKMLGANKLTNYELKFAGNLKLNREMGEQDVKVLSDFMRAKTNRIEEEQKFLNKAKEKNISPEKAQELWNEYDSEKPVYNFENRQINKQNLGKSNEYLNAETRDYTQEDLEHTAKLRGWTIERVKRELGVL